MHRLKDNMVIVAQLAEHRIVVPSVAGSSPVFHPTEADKSNLSVSFFCCFCLQKVLCKLCFFGEIMLILHFAFRSTQPKLEKTLN